MQLETERLVLRDSVMEDAEGLAACRTDERYWRYYDKPDDVEAAARDHIEQFIEWQLSEPRTHYQLALVRKDTRILIGDCGLRQRDQLSLGGDALPEADIGYELAPAYWGQGFATEAERAMVEFGFTQQGLHRIWSFCVAENEPSWRLMERIGMRREGVLRQNARLQDRWVDTLIYGLLAEERSTHG